jgi:5-methylcytosine-specific restriction endonuclease McrA
MTNKNKLEKANLRKKKWLKEGKCRECGDENPIKSNFCLKCYLIRVAAKRLGTGSYWKDLIALMENQSFLCALTGDKLVWGGEIELDHIIPESKDGGKILSNVRWVTKDANRIKQYLTDLELKSLCQKILYKLAKSV